MNDVIKQLYERKSVRAFTDEPIPTSIKEEILKAACEAATAGNQQLYTILDITDQSLKEKLVDTCDHQPFIANGQMVLIFLADCQKWYDAYEITNCNPRKPGVGDLMLACCDAMIAAQNAVVAAQSYGIGSCYIGDVMEQCEKQRELLNLTEYVFPVGMLVFGYPTQGQIDRVKPSRVDMKHIVHENTYRHMDNEENTEMFEPKAGVRPYDEWMQAFCNRKYNADFSKEMTRSVGKYLEAYEKEF